jgi:hypothetical protein
MAEEAQTEKVVDEFPLEIDGRKQYPQIVGQKIENNKVVAGVIVNSPDEHKKWLKNNPEAKEPKEEKKPGWAQQ